MNKEKMMKYFEVYNSGDYEKAVSIYYTQDAIFESADFKYTGIENIIKFFTEGPKGTSWKGITKAIKPINILIDGNSIAVEFEAEYQATEDVPDFFIKPVKKGEVFKKNSAGFYDIREGKISHARVYRFVKFRN